MQVAVPHQNTTCIVWYMHPFVKIKSDRVCPVNPLQPRPQGLTQCAQSTKSAVHVEPDLLSGRQVRQPVQVVNGTSVYRPRRSNDAERLQTGIAIVDNAIAQCLQVHPKLIVGRDLSQIPCANPQYFHCLDDALMYLGC